MLRWRPIPSETLLYCLTRDRELADALEGRLATTLSFFYNDAARSSTPTWSTAQTRPSRLPSA